MIRRFVTGVALATGLALSLTGCLGGAGEKVGEAGENLRLTAAQVLGKAAEKTGTDQGTVSFTGQMQYQVKPDLAYAMKFDDMSVGGQTMAGMEQRLVGRTMYMKMPAMPQLGGGNAAKPWLKISLDELGRQSGLNIDQLLQHMLRSAVEHGIETPEERLAADKPAGATIMVKFEPAGSALLRMTVRDDGRGRGIGLTFLRRAVARLGGQIAVAARPGQYTQFVIDLPHEGQQQEPQQQQVAQ